MKKLITGLLIIISMTGCMSVDYTKYPDGFEPIVKYDEFTNTNEYYSTFSLGDKDFGSTKRVTLDIGYNESKSKYYIYVSNDEIAAIRSVTLRSNELNKSVLIKNPGLTDIGIVSSTSFYIEEDEVIKMLEILKQDDFIMKISSVHSYELIKHRRYFEKLNVYYAKGFETFIKNKNSKSIAKINE